MVYNSTDDTWAKVTVVDSEIQLTLDTDIFTGTSKDYVVGPKVVGLLSLSSTAPTMPTGYTQKRLVGAGQTFSSTEFANFNVVGNSSDKEFYYEYQKSVLSGGSATSFTEVDCSGYVPILLTKWGIIAAMIKTDQASGVNYMSMRKNGSASTTQLSVYAPDDRYGGQTVARIGVDATGKIEYELNASTGDGYIRVLGFVMEL